MHEFSVMSQMIEGIIEEAKKWNATKVEEVILELGEFTMLGDEQLRFAYEILTKNTILSGSILTIVPIKGVIECDCGFRGDMSLPDDMPHSSVPILECPKCGKLARVVGGRECTVKNLRAVVPDV
ncbi:MAG: hydrogenase maturation nickel metallochaperone HypA [Thermoplasmata archaeon]